MKKNKKKNASVALWCDAIEVPSYFTKKRKGSVSEWVSEWVTDAFHPEKEEGRGARAWRLLSLLLITTATERICNKERKRPTRRGREYWSITLHRCIVAVCLLLGLLLFMLRVRIYRTLVLLQIHFDFIYSLSSSLSPTRSDPTQPDPIYIPCGAPIAIYIHETVIILSLTFF